MIPSSVVLLLLLRLDLFCLYRLINAQTSSAAPTDAPMLTPMISAVATLLFPIVPFDRRAFCSHFAPDLPLGHRQLNSLVPVVRRHTPPSYDDSELLRLSVPPHVPMNACGVGQNLSFSSLDAEHRPVDKSNLISGMSS